MAQNEIDLGTEPAVEALSKLQAAIQDCGPFSMGTKEALENAAKKIRQTCFHPDALHAFPFSLLASRRLYAYQEAHLNALMSRDLGETMIIIPKGIHGYTARRPYHEIVLDEAASIMEPRPRWKRRRARLLLDGALAALEPETEEEN